VVPAGAVTGPITVISPSGTSTSAFSFFIGETPEVLNAAPDRGKLGTSVVITGRHFTGAFLVSFGPSSYASFTVDSDVQITATVDHDAATGPISVTNPVGTGTSSFSFEMCRSTRRRISSTSGTCPTIKAAKW
jgi:hypothetical protein